MPPPADWNQKLQAILQKGNLVGVRSDLCEAIAEAMGWDVGRVFGAQSPHGGESSFRNDFWQGRAFPVAADPGGELCFNRLPLGVAVVESGQAASRATRDSIVDRIAPPDNGYEAIAVAVKQQDGSWRLDYVFHPKGWRLLDVLKEAFPSPPTRYEEVVTNPGEGHSTPNPNVPIIKKQLEKFKNVILQGPPGTGKTFLAEQLLLDLAGRSEEKLKQGNLSHLLGW